VGTLALARLCGVALGLTALTALVGVAVLAALACARIVEGGFAKALPGLVAMGAGGAALTQLPFIAGFGAMLGLGAVAVGVFSALLPQSRAESKEASLYASPGAGAAIALVIAAGTAWLGMRVHVRSTPQEIFGASDSVGRSISFFDTHFGGADFVQLDFQGDLRDPSVAARLLRLTDLLEPEVADVRSATQILGFLSHEFGGVRRIPASRESLNNLWFFLEGRPDVRSLVNDARTEAMIVLRVPSTGGDASVVAKPIEDSLLTGTFAAARRLTAIGARFHLPVAPVAVVASANGLTITEAENEEVNASVKKWLDSEDSPYQPTPQEWEKLEAALDSPDAERREKLTAAVPDPAIAAQLVDTLLAREKDIRLHHRAAELAGKLFTEEPARSHAEGVFADLLDPHANAGEAAKVSVTGLPVLAALIARELSDTLWRSFGLLLGIVGVIAFVARLKRAVVEALLATAVTLAVAGVLGLGIDTGCLTIFLLPPLAMLLTSGSKQLPSGVLVAFALAGAVLVASGVAPVARLGAALAVGLISVCAVHAASRRAG
jgi:hypothetical protein